MAGPTTAGGGWVKDLLLEAVKLKELRRAGWSRVGIAEPESVAGHAWGVSWLVVLLAPSEIDRLRAVEIAIVHDLPEVRVGDITPHDGIPTTEKHRREQEAAIAMFAEHPDLLDRWHEYQDGTTPEAIFVKDCDKLDMAIQAVRYADNCDTQEFIESARTAIRTTAVLRQFDVLFGQPANTAD